MSAKTKILTMLIGLGLIDTVIPIPILALILISVVFQKPIWFTDMVAIFTAPCKREVVWTRLIPQQNLLG